MPDIACVNGHAFAAGGMLALAQDFHIVRADRGFFCLPEVDLGLPLEPGMLALIECRMSPATFRDTILTGLLLGGADPGKGSRTCAIGGYGNLAPWPE